MNISSGESKELFDPIRKKWYKGSKEEIVRQKTIAWLLQVGGYNPSRIVVEKIIDSALRRRFDIAYMAKSSLTTAPRVLLLIECKADICNEKELQMAQAQLLGYTLKLPSVALAICSPKLCLHCFSHAPDLWNEGLPLCQNLENS